MKKWTAPRWMRPYLPFIVNTGGNDVADMMNGNADPRVNLPLSTLQCAVKSQVLMLERLYEADLLPPPRTVELSLIIIRQRHALQSIGNAVNMVADSGALPKRLRPGMGAIVETVRRGLGA